MFALHAQIDRTRAQRTLAMCEAAAYPQMGKDGRKFIDALIERCRGVIDTAAGDIERVFWNGSMLRGARALKAKAAEHFGRGRLT